MDIERIAQEAREFGFTLAAPISIETINPMTAVRDMCSVDKCRAYGKNWACPPACGSVEDCERNIKRYSDAIIVQTTAQLEDDFDFEGMDKAAKMHGYNFVSFHDFLREKYPGTEILALGTGGCMNCKECTYPDEPCRFPEKMVHPMEGYGIMISDVCKRNGIPYNHGRGTLTYIGCYLLKERETNL
ncbi:MAG: DUF2284 domain-containing protein [Clostridiales bacterium]|jgi:predicted metal-binding protein|nr:DUF2284 domain-containing protein [Clostridiales bacterium]